MPRMSEKSRNSSFRGEGRRGSSDSSCQLALLLVCCVSCACLSNHLPASCEAKGIPCFADIFDHSTVNFLTAVAVQLGCKNQISNEQGSLSQIPIHLRSQPARVDVHSLTRLNDLAAVAGATCCGTTHFYFCTIAFLLALMLRLGEHLQLDGANQNMIQMTLSNLQWKTLDIEGDESAPAETQVVAGFPPGQSRAGRPTHTGSRRSGTDSPAHASA